MKVAFRADASFAIGTGHIIRCLTLARALAVRGHNCCFVCRDLPGALGPLISQEFPLDLLPAPDGPLPEGPPAHATWAGVPWHRDAAETRSAIGTPDWLIVDHYAFDARWHNAVQPAGARVMVLDDLADRPHACDLLLDQNLGRVGEDYDNLLPERAERLIGPHYALLRSEFTMARSAALERRGGPLRNLLITLGGVDAINASGLCLAALATIPLPEMLKVKVALGPSAPHLWDLQAMKLPYPCEILVGANMSELMLEADACIGAAGGSAWERCAMGLPTLQLIVAENQRTAAAALVDAGAALSLGTLDEDLPSRLAKALAELSDPTRSKRMSLAAARVADGSGADRVVDALETPLALHPADMTDADSVWQWRADLPSAYFRAGVNPSLSDHFAWWARALADPDRHLMMAGKLAHLRIDRRGQTGEVSILLAPAARGRGIGGRLLAQLEHIGRGRGLRALAAKVAADNTASVRLFRAAGYSETGFIDGFHHFTRSLYSSIGTRQETR